MLGEYLKTGGEADGHMKPAKTRDWSCMICGVFVKRDEAWIDNRGLFCHKHGRRLKIKRVAENLR